MTNTLKIIIEILMLVLGVLLLMLSIYNIHRFIIKQKRYKQVNIVIFYVVANITIVFLIVVSTVQKPIVCSDALILMYTSIPNLSMILGICQATMLTTLAIQLNQLCGQKSELL